MKLYFQCLKIFLYNYPLLVICPFHLFIYFIYLLKLQESKSPLLQKKENEIIDETDKVKIHVLWLVYSKEESSIVSLLY